MDDYGTAGDLLKNLSSPILINSTPLCQDRDYHMTYSLPLARKVAGDRLLGGVQVLAFNHPVILEVGGNATALVRTSDLGWLDVNDSGTFDGNETYDAYTIVASASYGRGGVFVAGDADLLINGMLGIGDNRILLDNIMGNGTAYLDVSHGQHVTPLASLYYEIKYDALAQLLCASIILLLGLSSVAWGRALKKEKQEDTGPGSKRSSDPAAKDRPAITGPEK
jgi:hypothetical protein